MAGQAKINSQYYLQSRRKGAIIQPIISEVRIRKGRATALNGLNGLLLACVDVPANAELAGRVVGFGSVG